MPEKPSHGATVMVGRAEYEDLSRRWADYLAATRAGSGPVDPVMALQRTGEVLRALDRLLSSAETPGE